MGDAPELLVIMLGFIVITVLIIRYKLKKRELEMQGSAELARAVDALRGDLADMQEHTRAQLAEMPERDSTERLLPGGRESQEDTGA